MVAKHKPIIGVLAVQGGFSAHMSMLNKLNCLSREVRHPRDLYSGTETIDGLILPGGESSSQIILIKKHHLWQPLADFFHSQRPVLSTCAGTILLARHIKPKMQPTFSMLDIEIERNAWGRQVHSFEALDDENEMPLCFIRAPRILRLGPDVEVIRRFRKEPILVKQNAIFGTTFHPELSENTNLYRQIFGL